MSIIFGMMPDRSLEEKKLAMVKRQLEKRGITDRRVLSAMATIPREMFVPDESRHHSYDDGPLSIGFGQTISQPYVVASMLQELHLNRTDRVLEIGTGSGYQTAVLAEIVDQLWSIECLPELHERAKDVLHSLGYTGIGLELGDGKQGWVEHSPFDAIVVSAASDNIPPALIEQLADRGRLIIPVASSEHEHQDLVIVRKKDGIVELTTLYPVRFVPLT